MSVKGESLLMIDPSIRIPIIVDIINKCKKQLSHASIAKILIENKHEKLVPYNLWFDNPLYKIVNFFENNQNIRARYFDSTLLTPLLTRDNNVFMRIKLLMPSLSLYQPFYPENFYQIWEFLQKKHLKTDIKHFLHVGPEHKLGCT